MKILAIETGGGRWGVACVQCNAASGEARLVHAEDSELPRELSTHLVGKIASVLEKSGWGFQDVEALAVGLGPGSWTGLRIGLSCAKTLAQVRSWPIAGVPSFDATAQAAWRTLDNEAHLVLVASACRPGEINAKIYEARENYLAVLHPEWIGSLELVANTLSSENLARGIEAPAVLCGPAAKDVGAILEGRNEAHVFIDPPFTDVLLELALAGAMKIAGGEADDVSSLNPLYLAPSNAERNLLAR